MFDAGKLSAASSSEERGAIGLSHIAFIGNFPPRRCGIATFTADVAAAVAGTAPGLRQDVWAMSDGTALDYPKAVTGLIRQDLIADYRDAAAHINKAGVDAVCVQHEFGIFGGPAGSHLMQLLNGLECPVVTALHTVLDAPNDDQRRVMQALIQRSSKLIVMSQKGRDFLTRIYDAPKRKIELIPHGAPDRPLQSPAAGKAALGFAGRDLIVTFGLLSPNKGLESVIRTLPRIIAERPDALYLVIGATHPHLIAREGESYRTSLQNLAEGLGVARNLQFINAYLDTPELLDYLAAADVYVTPYLNEAQITSGTLAYAVAMGKPVVSTPYWHAAELLADGVGVLTPFNDSDAIGDEIAALLSDDARRQALAERAYQRGRETIWPRIGEAYVATLASAAEEPRRKAEPRKAALLPPPSYKALERMSDTVGMLQHARLATPDRNHGYCVDDNARALILTQSALETGAPDALLTRLASTYAAFLEHAWNEERGRFRNFMAYDRRWLEEEGSCDSCGRAFWAIGETALRTRDPELKRWALDLARHVMSRLPENVALRAGAFNMLGFTALLAAGLDEARAPLIEGAERLARAYQTHATSEWRWFECSLSYDNARLSEAMLRAGLALDQSEWTTIGADSLTWLTRRATAPGGAFRPVGTQSFGLPFAAPAQFDQQPLEAAAHVDACLAAYDVAGDELWLKEARRAFAWYLGENDHGVRMALLETGGCYDGLGLDGVNHNQGAESILSYQLALNALRARDRKPTRGLGC